MRYYCRDEMTRKSLGYALAAGVAAFLVVGLVVTEIASAWIEFSVFVGLPAGIVAGVAVAAAVAFGLADDSPQRYRLAGTIAGFGVGFLAAVVVFSGVVGLGVVLSTGLGVVVGLVAAVVSYLRGATTPDSTSIGPEAD